MHLGHQRYGDLGRDPQIIACRPHPHRVRMVAIGFEYTHGGIVLARGAYVCRRLDIGGT
jgi:hypothetical protein